MKVTKMENKLILVFLSHLKLHLACAGHSVLGVKMGRRVWPPESCLVSKANERWSRHYKKNSIAGQQ